MKTLKLQARPVLRIFFNNTYCEEHLRTMASKTSTFLKSNLVKFGQIQQQRLSDKIFPDFPIHLRH